MPSIDVTVIIPAYNAGAFIQDAILSALEQRDVVLEVIVVDDGSTDHTSKVVAAISDPRLKCLRHSTNRGPGAARNTAICHARGEWIAVLDADDTLLPARLFTLIQTARATGADIIADNAWSEEVPGGPRTKLVQLGSNSGLIEIDLTTFIKSNLMFGRTGVSWGYLKPLFKRSMFAELGIQYRTDLRISEDFDLIICALAKRARYFVHHSTGYVYRRHRPGAVSFRITSTNVAEMIQANKEFLERNASVLRRDEVEAMASHLRRLAKAQAFIAMIESIKTGKWRAFAQIALSNPGAIALFSPKHFRIRRMLVQFASAGKKRSC